jgi:Calcineurin-like phosphoesterase
MNRLFARFASRLGALALCAAFAQGPAHAGDAYEWVQISSDGVEARAITQEPECPRARIDGRETAMSLRAAPSAAFPVRVCAVKIPAGAKEAAIRDRPLALPPPRVDRILLVGDTGCRLNALVLQSCNVMKSWPFRLVADLAAEAAPDLALHVGDLVYRERECPVSNKGCAGSPFGDNWETWKAEFFDPARALLGAAPFVFVRGNHESCERNGAGWRRFVSAFPFDEASTCDPREPPYSFDLGGPALVVLDVTRAEDRAVDEAGVPLFREQFADLAKYGGPVWVAMHKPVYGSARVKDGVSEGHNKTLVEAARGALPPNVQAFLSGHLHTFQALSFVEDLPAQVIAGAGGDALDAFAPTELDGMRLGDATVDKGRGVAGAFGFGILARGEDAWSLTQFDARGNPLARCQLQGRKVSC